MEEVGKGDAPPQTDAAGLTTLQQDDYLALLELLAEVIAEVRGESRDQQLQELDPAPSVAGVDTYHEYDNNYDDCADHDDYDGD